MPYPPPESISHDDFAHILAKLGLLLENLPSNLPLNDKTSSKYGSFLAFSLDPDLLERTGCEVATLGEQLERVFGWKARNSGDGILQIVERGKGIKALHLILQNFYKSHPENNVLKKWVIDIAIGAEKVYEKYGVDIPEPSTAQRQTSGGFGGVKRPRSDSDIVEISSDKISTREPVLPLNSGRGRNPNELMGKLVLRYVDKETQKASWSCVAPSCTATRMGLPQLSRVLKHAAGCQHLRIEEFTLYQEAVEASKSGALGSRLEAVELAAMPDGDSKTQHHAQPPVKRAKMKQASLDISELQAAGKKRKSEEQKVFQAKVDHAIMRLICVRGLVPHVIDSPEWKELMALLNPQYRPTSSDTFSDDYIPREAVFVREKQIDLLRGTGNLTLTFDGTTIRKPQSFYTAHATTPSRESFFLDGHEGTGERHNMDWIMEKLTKTIDSIGRGNWGAACSDSTNVTKATRRETVKIIATILDLCDCCHHLQNTIKDITKLLAFKPLISMVKSILKHFSKSSYSTTLLRKERNISGDDEPVNSLQKIGKTRFGTHWSACNSLDPCLPGIRNLVTSKKISFKNTKVQGMFLNHRTSDKYRDFEKSLLHYINIVAPFIRALWSLEAAHANASDVFVFWLAIAATLKDLFNKPDETGIPRSLAEEVTAIYNKRYSEFFTNNVYFTAFMLDPRYPMSDFLNAPSNSRIIIPGVDAKTGQRPLSAPLPYPRAFDKVKEFLKTMLINMLSHLDKNHDESLAEYALLKEIGAEAAATELKQQLEAFWRGDWPFRGEVKDGNPLAWWSSLRFHVHARTLALLAIKIFSVLVNSMPDERTNSTFTWLNSPIRGAQTTQTLVDMIQIGQWYGKHQEGGAKDVPYRPAVKFRKISKTVLERLQTAEREVGEEEASDDESDDPETDSEDLPLSFSLTAANTLLTFDIDPNINIDSMALLDMISEKKVEAVAKDKGRQSGTARNLPKKTLSLDPKLGNWDW